jgi:hypothetical protein
LSILDTVRPSLFQLTFALLGLQVTFDNLVALGAMLMLENEIEP